MSIQADIMTALANVADGRVYPESAPEGMDPPYVIMRRIVYDPIMTLNGRAAVAKSTYIFECWGQKSKESTAKAASLATALDVRAAIEASATGLQPFFEAVSGEDFVPQTLEMMEPLTVSFWHDD